MEAVRTLGGTATTAQILELSTVARLRTALRKRELVRVKRGVYSVPGAATWGPFARAITGGVLSHQSAADRWKLEQLHKADVIHVTVARNNRPAPRPGIRLHWGDVVDEVVTSPVRTVLDCARILPFEEALAIADSACHQKLVTQSEIMTAADVLRGAGRARVRRVAEHADGRAAGPFESALRAILIEAGITGFSPQLAIPGLPFRVDLGDPRRRIVLEADSFTFHGDRAALARDCRRYDELVSHGWRVLRFAWEHVRGDRRWVLDTVSRTCALAHATVAARRSGGIQEAPG